MTPESLRKARVKALARKVRKYDRLTHAASVKSIRVAKLIERGRVLAAEVDELRKSAQEVAFQIHSLQAKIGSM